MKNKSDISSEVGTRFGRLLVIGVARDKNGERKLLCQCDCGNTALAKRHVLQKGATKSCGCLRLERLHAGTPSRLSHGLKGTVVYRVWAHMKERCYRVNHKSYKDYGARGIVVCDRWKNSVEAFVEDMGTPERGMSLDRIDVNGNYEPSNCRWATATQQQRNKTNNRILTMFGESKCMAEWAEDKRCVVPETAFKKRLESGWDCTRALTVPPRPDRRRKTHSNRDAVVWVAVRGTA